MHLLFINKKYQSDENSKYRRRTFPVLRFVLLQSKVQRMLSEVKIRVQYWQEYL